jgi:hypothetical protein
MKSSGNVKYEMRLVFNRSQGENPLSRGALAGGESGEFVELICFINYPWKIRQKPAALHFQSLRGDGSMGESAFRECQPTVPFGTATSHAAN